MTGIGVGEFGFLAGAGVVAGVCGTVAGLASLVSYPALLAVGLSPVAANVTNTVGLVGNVVGAMAGAQPELKGQAPRIRKYLTLTLSGGIIGAAMLLLLPAAGFDAVVPLLIAGSAVLMLLRPWILRRAEERRLAAIDAGKSPSRQVGPQVAVLLVGVYGGYFGAGAGIMMMALLAVLVVDALARVSALRNVLMGSINGVAAIFFAFFGPVHWLYALPLGGGFILGGYMGPWIVRRISADALRVVVAIGGFVLAIDLGWQAYT
jgi:uncharacterized membrane protein YfcA